MRRLLWIILALMFAIPGCAEILNDLFNDVNYGRTWNGERVTPPAPAEAPRSS